MRCALWPLILASTVHGQHLGQRAALVYTTTAAPTKLSRSAAVPNILETVTALGSITADSVTADSIGSTTTLAGEDSGTEGSTLLQRLEQMEGIWYSDDFYGPHGREWVTVSATLVGAGTASLVAVKVTGDANIPSGHTTWRTRGLPDVGGSDVTAQIQVRADANDPNGFSWIPGALSMLSEDTIALSVNLELGCSTGTFYKHKVHEAS